MIKVDEPDDETACLMLRGLKERYARYHGVHIQDAAVKAAVTLFRRYLTGRQLPDKTVDLLDMASARVRMSLDTVPEALTQRQAQLTAFETEQQAIEADRIVLPTEEDNTCLKEIAVRREEVARQTEQLTEQYQSEKRLAQRILDLRQHSPKRLNSRKA